MKDTQKTMGWGITNMNGSEIWDAEPTFKSAEVSLKDKILLYFYPKKWFLYHYLSKTVKSHTSGAAVLDVGCGTGGAVIDLKRLFGEKVDVFGVDVVRLQVDLAVTKLKTNNVEASIGWFDGVQLPFENNSFHGIHSSDVLGHVEHVSVWLLELNRVLKSGGSLAMFSESKLGKHAYVRKYLFDRGLNLDPHAQYHISLYSKQELKNLVENAGFEVEKMYSSFWAAFFVHPDEMYPALQSQSKFPILKKVNEWLYRLKKKTHPYSTAFGELYGLMEMLLIGKYIESQGYIILAKKK